jgi:hypothetical protein
MRRLLICALLCAIGFAQTNVWIQRGPEGGNVGRPVIDPQNPGTMYAVAGAGSCIGLRTQPGTGKR